MISVYWTNVWAIHIKIKLDPSFIQRIRATLACSKTPIVCTLITSPVKKSTRAMHIAERYVTCPSVRPSVRIFHYSEATNLTSISSTASRWLVGDLLQTYALDLARIR